MKLLHLSARSQTQSGFTLIELLVSITIISLLTVIGAVTYIQTSVNARDAKRKADLETVRQALVLYKTDSSTGLYPNPYNHGSGQGSSPNARDDFKTMITNDLKNGGFLSSTQNIIDPKDGTYPYGYRYVSATGGVFSLCVTLEKTSQDYCVTNP